MLSFIISFLVYLVAVLIRFFMISHLYMYVTVINMLSFIISLFNIFFQCI
jgi:hypothetical protein